MNLDSRIISRPFEKIITVGDANTVSWPDISFGELVSTRARGIESYASASFLTFGKRSVHGAQSLFEKYTMHNGLLFINLFNESISEICFTIPPLSIFCIRYFTTYATT